MVQEHSARRLHWDLRLEHDGTLASWALPRGVPEHPAENRLAVPLQSAEAFGPVEREVGGTHALEDLAIAV